MSYHNHDVMLIISHMRIARQLAKELCEDVSPQDDSFVNNIETECWEYLEGTNFDVFSDEDDVLKVYEKLMEQAR